MTSSHHMCKRQTTPKWCWLTAWGNLMLPSLYFYLESSTCRGEQQNGTIECFIRNTALRGREFNTMVNGMFSWS